MTRVQIDQAQRDARIAAALLEEVKAKLALLKAGSREEDITEARARRAMPRKAARTGDSVAPRLLFGACPDRGASFLKLMSAPASW